MRLGERPFGAHDALGDGRLGHEEGTRDLLGRQTSKQAQCQRNARIGRKDRVTGDEDQAQQVVADLVVGDGVEIRLRNLLLELEVAAEQLALALKALVATEQIDRAPLGDGREPGARVIRDSSAATSAS